MMSDTNQTIVSCGDSVVMSSIGATCRRAGLEVVSLDMNQPDPAEQLRRLSPDVILYDLAHPPADLVLQSLALDPGRLLIGVDLDRDCMLVLSGQQERAVTATDLLRVIETWRGSPRPLASWQAYRDRAWQSISRGFAALRARLPRQELAPAPDKKGKRDGGKAVDQAMNLANKRQISINMDSSRKENAMMNMTRRTRTLLAFAGVVIVVVVAGLVVLGPSAGLFGGDIIHISPENSTIGVGQSIDLSINSVSNCTWSSSVTGIVNILNYNSSGDRNITVHGVQPGTTTIKANCIVNRYTTVTVAPPPVISPANPVIGVGQALTLSTGDATCKWTPSSTAAPILSLSLASGASTVVTGLAAGTQTITAVCAFGTASTAVTVNPLSITPANPTIDGYGNVTLTVQGPSGTSCTWASSVLSPRIVSSTATTAVVYGVALSSATITATCNTGTVSTLVSYNFQTLAITPDRPQTCPLYAVKLTAQKTGVALNCTWSTSNSYYVSLYNSTASTTLAEGEHVGGARVTATCNGETAYMDVGVANLSRCSGILR